MCVFYSIEDVARVLTLIAILYNHSYSPLVYYSPPLPNQPIHSHPPIRIPPNPLLLISYAHAIADSIPSTHQNHTRSLLFALEYRDQPHRHIIFLLQ